MSGPSKILVVDDSAVVRGLLTSIFNDESDLDVVGTASNGSIGLKKIAGLSPDLVVLDIEMPVMDGLTTLVEIRKLYPRLPVVMFSTLTEHGAAATVDALSKGASDWATKPGQTTGIARAREHVRSELVAKVRALVARRAVASRPFAARPALRSPANKSQVDAVVLGCSTGGPVALEQVLASIDPALDVPVFVVQHMPPRFTAALAERLNRKVASTVVEATGGLIPQAGFCYIAPGDQHLRIRGRTPASAKLELTSEPPVNSCRPAVDVLFDSAAQTYGSHLLGVVLTGMGNDGATGSKELARLDCSILAQDEETSVVWGMPRAVVEAGVATEVLPLSRIGPRITELVNASSAGRVAARRGGGIS